jgi:deazaflavin-dependent oxidoreductase (nitroreductase family)
MPTSSAKPFTPAQERVGSVVIKLMSAANTWIYRVSGGRIGSSFFGAPVMLLTTTGRRSGQPRTAPLLYLRDGERIVTVASKGGMSHHPLWYRNLEAHPDVEVEIGATKQRMRARCANAEEKRAYWPKLVSMYADYAVYQTRTTRDIPVVILDPVR